jgi:hypothetical protein
MTSCQRFREAFRTRRVEDSFERLISGPSDAVAVVVASNVNVGVRFGSRKYVLSRQ